MVGVMCALWLKTYWAKKIAFHFTVLVLGLAAEVKWLAKYVILKVLTL